MNMLSWVRAGQWNTSLGGLLALQSSGGTRVWCANLSKETEKSRAEQQNQIVFRPEKKR